METSDTSPAGLAHLYLARYWDGNLPVNPKKIAEDLSLEVIPMYGWEFSGYYDPSSKHILYNGDEHLVRRRFTIAHELGHFALKHPAAPRDKLDSFSASIRSPIESAANRFAAELLMPKESVRIVARARGMSSVDEMAQAFGVSKLAMAFRLNNLKLD
ncbi:MAG: ImmA/IrrE family metallo-endopeptidase [Pseudomonadota bacterium]